MIFVLFILFLTLIFVNSIDIFNETKLVFNVYHKDIHVISLRELSSHSNGIKYNEIDLLSNTSGIKSYIGQIDYSLAANLLIWRSIEPQNGFYAFPLNKSAENLLGIKDKTLILKLNKSLSTRLSLDWIHNLVYYNLNNKIIVFNLSEPSFGYIVVRDKTFDSILDLSVNPLDSLLFWSVSDNSYSRRGRIMRSSADGLNQMVLIESDLREPIALTIDLLMRRVFWIDRLSFKFGSIDFEGKGLKILLESKELFTLSYYLTVFGEDIYWSNYYHSSVLKTNKYGLNGTQINYLIRADIGAEVEAIKIIDPSLQPKSINRCYRSKCSHLCLPVNEDQYRCVCPQLIFNNTLNIIANKCRESINSIEKSIFNSLLTTTTEQNSLTFDSVVDFSETYIEFTNQFQTELNLNTESHNLGDNKTNTSCVGNSAKKTLYIKNYKTSNVLYIVLIISLTLNFTLLFAFIFHLYLLRKRKLKERIRAETSLAQFKPVEFEMVNSETYHLINSNPLISNESYFLRIDSTSDTLGRKRFDT